MSNELDYRIDDLPDGVRLVLLVDDREVGSRDTDMDEAVALGSVWLNADLDDDSLKHLEAVAAELVG